MKKTALVFAIVLATCTSILAQTGNYKRLRIYTNDAGLVKLTTLGIETDHGDYRKNVGLSPISVKLKLLKFKMPVFVMRY
ncbi:MAG: hypothetical protein IPG39_06415 [Bacteroidetes bacterium]|nr:hypothetical protein [Bacteroidota bacterium]